MKIRDVQPDDAQALYTLFYESVHQVAIRDYNFEQRKAWAPIDYDQQAWVERLAKNKPYVVEQQGQPVAFADLQANGYIDQFFVSAHMPRQGIGTYLMQHLLQQAKLHHMPLLFSNLSISAQPFFQHFDFVIVQQQMPVVRGVALSNALMHKVLL